MTDSMLAGMTLTKPHSFQQTGTGKGKAPVSEKDAESFRKLVALNEEKSKNESLDNVSVPEETKVSLSLVREVNNLTLGDTVNSNQINPDGLLNTTKENTEENTEEKFFPASEPPVYHLGNDVKINLETEMKENVQAADPSAVHSFIKKDSEIADSISPEYVGWQQTAEPESSEKKKENIKKQSEAATVQEHIQPIIHQISKIVSEIKEGSMSVRDTAKLLDLLKGWEKMQKQTGNDASLHQLINLDGNDKNKQAKFILLNVAETYQKRTAMEHSGSYKHHAVVSVTDVINWVKQAMERYPKVEASFSENKLEQGEGKEEVKYQGQSSLPMTKIEQLIVHGQQGTKEVTEQQKLEQEFEQVLKTVRLNQVNGNTELSLKVKPVNLGEITIKMV